jgi:hypothetical protein
MIFAEDSEREAIEVVAVCGIAKGAEVRVMGRRDVQAAVFLEKAVKLLHGADYVRHMLYDMRSHYGVKRAITKRVRIVVQVAEHVGGAGRTPVNAYSARPLIQTATDVQNGHSAILPCNLA